MILPPEDQDIKSVLGLQGYEVQEIRQEGAEHTVVVNPPRSGKCPRCGTASFRVHQRARRVSRVLWRFMGDERLWVELHRRRLWCVLCQQPFTQRLPGVGSRQRVSVRAQVTVLEALKERSFAALRAGLARELQPRPAPPAAASLPVVRLDRPRGKSGADHVGA